MRMAMARGPAAPDSGRAHGVQPRGRRLARLMFYSHLWIGITTTAMLLIVAVTGILLNHKRGFGLMPDVAHEPSGSFEEALPLWRLAEVAERRVGPAIAASGIDRMDVRPGDGIVKVRFNDRHVTEVDVDLVTGEAVGSDGRNDVFLEKLHSGEIMGKRWVLLSDVAAAGLVLVLISGVWLWLFPKSRL
jgi:hypothetical protein